MSLFSLLPFPLSTEYILEDNAWNCDVTFEFGWKHGRVVETTILSVQCLTCIGCLLVVAISYYYASKALKHRMSDINNEFMRRRMEQSKRVTRMFGIIFIIFVVLTLPNMLRNVCYSFLIQHGYEKRIDDPYHSATAFLVIAMYNLNSCVNPIIYSKMHAGVRSFVRRNLFHLKSHGTVIIRNTTMKDDGILSSDSTHDVCVLQSYNAFRGLTPSPSLITNI